MPIRLSRLELVTCHRKPERSFHWKGRQFPVCARCTGIYLGFLSYPFFLFDFAYLNFYLSVALILPSVVDGFTQAWFNRESNNILRLTTGITSGIGIMSLACITGDAIYTSFLYLLKIVN